MKPLLIAIALVACSSAPDLRASVPSISTCVPSGGELPRLAIGCLAVCTDATYVELSPKGDLCRCWAPNAFAYTFAFPESDDALAYARGRWRNGLQAVLRCRRQGLGWEASADKEQIICVQPGLASPPPTPERT